MLPRRPHHGPEKTGEASSRTCSRVRVCHPHSNSAFWTGPQRKRVDGSGNEGLVIPFLG